MRLLFALKKIQMPTTHAHTRGEVVDAPRHLLVRLEDVGRRIPLYGVNERTTGRKAAGEIGGSIEWHTIPRFLPTSESMGRWPRKGRLGQMATERRKSS
jgi:hypothetical protein